MTLRGALQEFPLESVLQLLADTGKTGRLTVSSDDLGGTLGLSEGRLVSARYEDDSGDPALGVIFGIERGEFEFVTAERIAEGDLTGELEELLERAVVQRDRFAAVREVVPSERTRFRLSERAAERGEVRLSAEQWRALLAVDGQRDVAAIAERLGVRRLEALDLLATLVRAGMLDPVEPEAGDVGLAFRRLRPMQPLPATRTGEPIALRADVPELPLETILQLLAHTEKTGRVELRSDEDRATIGFDKGRLTSATWEEEVGELALGAAFAAAPAVVDLIPMAEAPSANTVGELDELLDRAAGTRDRILLVRTLIPDERMRFSLSERATEHAAITLSSDEWRALLAVNGERDVPAIAEQMRMRRLPTMVILTDLIQGGLIDALPAPEPAQPAVPPPSPARELEWPFVERRRLLWPPAVAPVPEAETPAEAELEAAAEAVPAEPEVAESEVAERGLFEPPVAEPEVVEPEAAEALSAAEPAEAAAEVEPEEAAAEVEERAAETEAAAPETETPLAETPVDAPEEDDRLAAISGVIGPAEPAPPPAVWEPPPGEEAEPEPITEVPPPPSWETPAWEPAPAEPTAEEAPAEIDPRLAAFGLGAPPTEPAAPEWEAPPAAPEAEAAPAEPTWTTPAEPVVEPAPVEADRPASEPVIDIGAPPAEVEAAPTTGAAEPGAESAVPAAPTREGPLKALFGRLFGRHERPAAVPAAPAAPPARTRSGQLALFVNELLAGYNSGRYGKGRVEDRILPLLMRVDEQADPIDRPIPVRNDRLDVATIDGDGVPERQALPYLAILMRQVYDDAERALGKDKAKRGFRDVRERLFGKDLTLFRAPEVAGRVPKV